jgi:hypothetical protein
VIGPKPASWSKGAGNCTQELETDIIGKVETLVTLVKVLSPEVVGGSRRISE